MEWKSTEEIDQWRDYLVRAGAFDLEFPPALVEQQEHSDASHAANEDSLKLITAVVDASESLNTNSTAVSDHVTSIVHAPSVSPTIIQETIVQREEPTPTNRTVSEPEGVASADNTTSKRSREINIVIHRTHRKFMSPFHY